MAPTSSALQPTECVVVDVTFDSTGLALDVYNAALDVNSNDPDEPVIELPAQLTVVAPAITLDKTVGAVPGVCAPYDTIDIPVGIEVFYCYTVENVGDATFTYHTLNDTELGVLLFDEPIVLDPGESYSYVHTGVVITETVVNTGTWYAYLSQGGYYVSAVDQATVTALFPAITLDKTVGLGPECATTDSLTVPAGTEVTYCYEG